MYDGSFSFWWWPIAMQRQTENREESSSVMGPITEQCMNEAFRCSEDDKMGLIGPGSSLMCINKYVGGNCRGKRRIALCSLWRWTNVVRAFKHLCTNWCSLQVGTPTVFWVHHHSCKYESKVSVVIQSNGTDVLTNNKSRQLHNDVMM